MIRGLYTATSGMLCQEAVTDITAANLANANTAGFKKDRAVFRDFPEMFLRRMNDPNRKIHEIRVDPLPYVGKMGTGAIVDEIFNDKTQGDLQLTGNTMDFGLQGKGFFTVQTPNGPAFTRNGEFSVSSNGVLMTHDGFPVIGRKNLKATAGETLVDENGNLPEDASEIIAGDAKSIEVTSDGTVYIDNEASYRLMIVDFENPERVLKRGKNLFFAASDSGKGISPQETLVNQRYIEASNVSVIESMVRLITAQRSYEANQKSIQSEDAMLGKAVNDIAR